MKYKRDTVIQKSTRCARVFQRYLYARNFHPPRDPPRDPRLMRPFRALSSGIGQPAAWHRPGIEPVPAETTTSPGASRPRRLRLSLDPSSGEQIAPPCDPQRRTFASWTTTPISAPAATRREMSALPPDAHRPGRGGTPWTPGGAGVTARSKPAKAGPPSPWPASYDGARR